MKLKQSLSLLSTVLLAAASADSLAGKQGVSSYYGAGLGLANTKGADTTPSGHLMFGFEEDGWFFEGVAFSTVDAGTDIPTLDYTVSGTDIGLGYRSIEKNGTYYLIKYSSTSVDFKLKETRVLGDAEDDSGKLDESGNTYTLGVGFRAGRDERMEVRYSFNNIDNLSDPIHLLSFSYLWGGAMAQGMYDKSNESLLSVGLVAGQFSPDLGEHYDDASVAGISLQFNMNKMLKGLFTEFQYVDISDTDSYAFDPNDPLDNDYPDEYSGSILSVFMGYRTPGDYYIKGKLGYSNIILSDEVYILTGTGPDTFGLDEVVKADESGASVGLGLGMKADNFSVELEYTQTRIKISGTDIDPSLISLGLMYHF